MKFELDHALPILARTPATLRVLLGGLPDEWTRTNEGADTWSPFDVVGHLIHGELTDWIPRARIILEQRGERRFTSFDRFAQFEASRRKSMAELLDRFATLREDNLTTLAAWSLTEQQMELDGEHPELGPVTLRQLLATWVAHDLGHVAQITRVMARQYRDTVGPWQEYLPVMRR